MKDKYKLANRSEFILRLFLYKKTGYITLFAVFSNFRKPLTVPRQHWQPPRRKLDSKNTTKHFILKIIMSVFPTSFQIKTLHTANLQLRISSCGRIARQVQATLHSTALSVIILRSAIPKIHRQWCGARDGNGESECVRAISTMTYPRN